MGTRTRIARERKEKEAERKERAGIDFNDPYRHEVTREARIICTRSDCNSQLYYKCAQKRKSFDRDLWIRNISKCFRIIIDVWRKVQKFRLCVLTIFFSFRRRNRARSREPLQGRKEGGEKGESSSRNVRNVATMSRQQHTYLAIVFHR